MILSKISVIIPVFNRVHCLLNTVDSIIKQEYQNWELILVDDGSTDGSIDLINSIAERDQRVRLIRRTGQVSGANICRNIGLEASTGEFIIFLDSDDLLRKECFMNRIARIHAHPECDFWVFSGATFNDDEKVPNKWWNLPSQMDDLSRFFMLDSPWQTTGPTWRKDFLIRIGILWDEQLALWQDIDFHIQVLLGMPKYMVFWNDDADYLVRSNSADSISRMNYYKQEKIKSRIYFFHKYLSLFRTGKISGWKFRRIFLVVLKSCYVHGANSEIRNLLVTGVSCQIISRYEKMILNTRLILSTLNKNSIFKFPGKRISNSLERGFPDTLQKINYSNPPFI